MKKMLLEQKFIIDLVSLSLFNTQFSTNDYDLTKIDFKYVAKKVKEQKMDAIIYNAFETLKIDHPIVNFLKKSTSIISYLTLLQPKSLLYKFI